MDEKTEHANWVEFDVELPEGANPVSWVTLTEDKVRWHRYQNCPNYNICLSFAAGRAWVSFTCTFCSKARDYFNELNKQERRNHARLGKRKIP